MESNKTTKVLAVLNALLSGKEVPVGGTFFKLEDNIIQVKGKQNKKDAWLPVNPTLKSFIEACQELTDEEVLALCLENASVKTILMAEEGL
jgi:hypothetical protein